MPNKKNILITIVVLLCIFTPLSIIGILNKTNINPLEENPNHEMYYDGHIWFYDVYGNFLSKYECLTEICELTTPVIDDDTYQIKYYKNGDINKTSLISETYAFITDGANIYLYLAETGKTLETYKRVKTYNTSLENNSYIIENSKGEWGVLSISKMLNVVLPFSYSFIGIVDSAYNDNVLNTDKFIVKKDNFWYIVDDKNNALTGYIDDPIIDYNNDYVFSKNQDKIRIYGYDNLEYLQNYDIKDYIVLDKYIGIITSNFVLIFDDLKNPYLKSVALTESEKEVELELNNNKIDIKINGVVSETLELS